MKKIFFVLLLVMLFVACSQGDEVNIAQINPDFNLPLQEEELDETEEVNEPDPTPIVTSSPVQNNTLRLAIPMPSTLNPLLNSDANLLPFFSLIFEPLIVFNADNEPLANPALLQSMFLSGSAIALTLQDGIFWEDGTPITTADIVFSINTIRNAPNSAFSQNIENITSTGIVNERTINLNLANPSIVAKYMLNFPIIPSHYYSQANMNQPRSPRNMHPLGNGPFRFLNFREGEFIQLVANDFAINQRPNIPEIQAIILRDFDDEIYAFERGLVDVFVGCVSYAGRLLARGANQISEFDGQTSQVLLFNFSNYLFHELQFRQAIAIALETTPTNLTLPDDITEINIIANIQNPNTAEIAQTLTQNLEGAGLDVSLELLEFAEFNQRALNFEFDIMLGAISESRSPIPSILGSTLFNYHSELLNALIYIANTAQVDIALEIALSDMQSYITSNLPFISLGQNKLALYTSSRLADVQAATINIFQNIHSWRLN